MTSFIENLLQKKDHSGFFSRYVSFRDYMNTNIHPHITRLSDSSSNGKSYYNDHGLDHILKIIDKISSIIRGNEAEDFFTTCEIFILLCATHIHDVGNVYGRDGHENNHEIIINALNQIIGDAVTINFIRRIAAAHGGNIDGDKDKISHLSKEENIMGEKIRPQVMAAILRLADELSDDVTRTHQSIILENIEIPEESRIFHMYSSSLHNVNVEKDIGRISLSYHIQKDKALLKYKYNGEYIFLIDYINDRVKKMYEEAIYCSRFMRKFVYFGTISVKINILDSNVETLGHKDIIISYTIDDSGYPIIRWDRQNKPDGWKTGEEVLDLIKEGKN